MADQWQYEVAHLDRDLKFQHQSGRGGVQNLFETYAKGGWEFVESFPHQDTRMFIFKKPAPPA
jgi:hypothetical protein